MTVLPVTTTDVQRVRYSEGQYLTAADFRLDQDYHRHALARHELGGHTWGVVVGLELVEVPDTSDLALVDVHLSPGLAIDGYGRQVVSFAKVVLDASLFDAFVDDAHRSVWITYDEQTARPAADGWAECDTGEETRTVEAFRVLVDPVQTMTDVIVEGVPAAPPPAPAGVTEIPADTSVPYQELPVEPPVGRWLVRLGTVRWDGAARRFRPAAPGRLAEGRRYVGAIASEVLAPAATLRVAPRAAAADTDAADFATVEGRLRVQGRVNAERELWMEGDPIRFTRDLGAEDGVPITLGRDAVGGNRLRLQLGTAADAATMLSVSAGDETSTSLEARADGRLRVPVGPLEIGPAALQEVELSGPGYGIGTQRPGAGAGGTLYQRSRSQFAWYTGGEHDPAELEPGTGGTLRLTLDSEGSLDFGSSTHQMLKLYTSGGSPRYGIGVQNSTLYFRTNHDVAWFHQGSHVDGRGSPGAGGTLRMLLDESPALHVFGALTTSGDATFGAGGNAAVKVRHINGKQAGSDGDDRLHLNWDTGFGVQVGSSATHADLDVHGALTVHEAGEAAVEGVVKVVTRDLEVTNQFAGGVGLPQAWSLSWAGEFSEVYAAFVVVNGFSVVDGLFDPSPSRVASDTVVPQHVWARLLTFSAAGASGTAFCAQSDGAADDNNTVAITVVGIGRRWV